MHHVAIARARRAFSAMSSTSISAAKADYERLKEALKNWRSSLALSGRRRVSGFVGISIHIDYCE